MGFTVCIVLNTFSRLDMISEHKSKLGAVVIIFRYPVAKAVDNSWFSSAIFDNNRTTIKLSHN